MCGRFTLRTPLAVLMKQFAFESNLRLALRYNIAPTQDVLTVRQVGQKREPAIARWGLIPFWAKDLKISTSLINARSEEAAKKPSFRAAMKTAVA